jgi:hypothetical protein
VLGGIPCGNATPSGPSVDAVVIAHQEAADAPERDPEHECRCGRVEHDDRRKLPRSHLHVVREHAADQAAVPYQALAREQKLPRTGQQLGPG